MQRLSVTCAQPQRVTACLPHTCTHTIMLAQSSSTHVHALSRSRPGPLTWPGSSSIPPHLTPPVWKRAQSAAQDGHTPSTQSTHPHPLTDSLSCPISAFLLFQIVLSFNACFTQHHQNPSPDTTSFVALSLSSAGWSHTFFNTVSAASGDLLLFSAAFTASECRNAS